MNATERMDANSLETIIDRHGLRSVLEMMANVCWEKGQHLRSNWQDPKTAQDWEMKGGSLMNESGKSIYAA